MSLREKTKREIINYQIEKLSESTPLNDRVALWNLFRQFSLHGGIAFAVELANLTTLQMGGDLVGFMATWDTCLSVMSKLPETDILIAILEI